MPSCPPEPSSMHTSEMLDRPPTPVPVGCMDSDLRFHENGCPCEWGESYRPGGYHPVHIGDILVDRYEILCKLGYGSSATVWLAADSCSKLFVAVKILRARLSQAAQSELSLYRVLASTEEAPYTAHHLNELLTSFDLIGPNGQHTCFVFEAMGPNLSDMLRSQEFQVGDLFDDDSDFCYRFPRHLSKRVLKGVLRGLAYLHSHEVVHGDLHKGNILVNVLLPQYSADSSDRLRQSASEERPLDRLDGTRDLWAPRYLLPPASLRSYVSTELEPLTKLTDLGGAFCFGAIPDKIVTPDYLRAPETILGLKNTIGPGIDIWSFGCLLFELLTGSVLFEVSRMFAGGGETLDDVHMIQLTEVVGPLPEQMFGAWRRGSCYFDDKTMKRTFNPGGDESMEDWSSPDNEMNESEDKLSESDDGESTLSEDDEVISDSEDILARIQLSEPLEAKFSQKKPEDMGEVEEKQILHLLRRILQHDPAKRPSAEEILGHEWFQT